MPIFVYSGDDVFSMRKAVGGLMNEAGFDRVDVEKVNAAATAPQAVLMTAGTEGLFAERRMVVVEGLGTEKKSARSKAKSDDSVLSLEELVAVTPETTTVLVTLTALRSDSRVLKDVARLAKEGKLVHRQFAAPKPRDMTGWLTNAARSMDIKLELNAARQLAVRVGDQSVIAGVELEKLGVAAGPDGVVTQRMVEALVAKTADESVFPLIDAVAARQAGTAFALLATQLAQSQGSDDPSVGILRLIARQLRLLLSIKLLSTEGKRRDEIISTLKLPEYFADRYFSQAAKLSGQQLADGIERLAATDQSLKNGDAGPAAVQLLIADLTRPAATA